MYEKMKKILELAWSGDDHISQDDLFELQAELADLTLEIAKESGKTLDLVKSFPWLYKIKGTK